MPLCSFVSRNLPRKPPSWRPSNRPKGPERGSLGGSYLLDAKTVPKGGRHTRRSQKRRSHQVRTESHLCPRCVHVKLCLAHHVAVSRDRARCYPSKMDSNAPSNLPVSRRLGSQSYMVSARLNLDGSVPSPRDQRTPIGWTTEPHCRPSLLGRSVWRQARRFCSSKLPDWTIESRARLSDNENMVFVDAASREISFSMYLDD